MAKSGEEIEQFIVDSRGRKKAVILPMARYRQLMEDLHDLGVILERRDEPSSPLEEVEERLRKDDLLPGRD
jgi:PHD/YefM family antitoxin component YafN of YafNO toxin-antitoxin module